MLVEFSVKNFMSIKETLTLSMHAIAKKNTSKVNKNKLSKIRSITLNNGKTLYLLPMLVIYGENAGGKSNILKALCVMQNMILCGVYRNFQTSNTMMLYNPFQFNQEYKNAPTEFNITLVVRGNLYKYKFTMNQERVLFESLSQYTTNMKKPTLIFSRDYDNLQKKYIYNCESELFQYHGLSNTFANDCIVKTNDDVLFLFISANFKHNTTESICEWIAQNLITNTNATPVTFNGQSLVNAHLLKITKDYIDNNKNEVLHFLQEADLLIKDIDMKQIAGTNGYDILLKYHADGDCNDAIKLEYESDGTKKIFFLCGVWLRALKNNQCLILDEMSNFLHTLLAKFLIKQFKAKNNCTAQLIFTTHDITLLEDNIFTDDEIWFCSKNSDKSTKLHSLNEYQLSINNKKHLKTIKQQHNIIKDAYLHGYYNAVPLIDNN